MSPDKQTIDKNFTNHKPNAEGIRKIEQMRHFAKQFGYAIVDTCPDSREKSLAITNLEQALFYANAAIARAQENQEDIKHAA